MNYLQSTVILSGVYLDNCIIHQLHQNFVIVWNVETGILETIALPLNDKSIIYYQNLVIKYYSKELNVKKEFERNFIHLKKLYDQLHSKVIKNNKKK